MPFKHKELADPCLCVIIYIHRSSNSRLQHCLCFVWDKKWNTWRQLWHCDLSQVSENERIIQSKLGPNAGFSLRPSPHAPIPLGWTPKHNSDSAVYPTEKHTSFIVVLKWILKTIKHAFVPSVMRNIVDISCPGERAENIRELYSVRTFYYYYYYYY